MSATAGYLAKLSLNTTGAPFAAGDEVGGINKESMKVNRNQLDITQFKNQLGWHEFIAGLGGATFDISGYVDRANAPQELLRTKLLTPNNLFFQALGNTAGSTGSKGFQGQVWVENYQEDLDVNNLYVFNATLRVTAAVAIDS